MKILVSYCDSAQAAEGELLDFFDGLQGRYEQSSSSFLNQGSDSLLCVLLGLVCDLQPDEDGGQGKVFVGLLGEQSFVSFPLHYSAHVPRDRAAEVFFATNRNIFHGNRSPEIWPSLISADPNSTSRLMESAVPAPDIAFRYETPNGRGENGKYQSSTLADVAREHLKPPIFQLWDFGSPHADWSLSSPRMSDFLTLLTRALKGASSPAVIQELVGGYRCKLAWASIQLGVADFGSLRRSTPDISERLSETLIALYRQRRTMEWSSASWENRKSSTKSFGVLPLQYSLLVERRNHLSWSWLQLLALVAHAGRRASARLRIYNIPDVLRFRWRRRNATARGRVSGAAQPNDSIPTQTVADLFRGGDGALPVGHELRQRTMRLTGRKGLLLKIERSLIVPDRDTVYSLFRGGGSPVRATARKSRGNV